VPYRKKIIGIIILSLLLTFEKTICSETKPKTSRFKIGTLIIEFTGINNNKGKVLAGLYNESKKFPKENKALQNLKKAPKNNKCIINAPNLPYGDYAVAAMHDENESGNMDFNFIGLPTEIYGFSNNRRPGLLGPPRFKACMFKIDKPVVKIKIHLK
tara:strand:- start:24 stop:494 length:471 start_codon:yes stop_codon:yes gene_type:complete